MQTSLSVIFWHRGYSRTPSFYAEFIDLKKIHVVKSGKVESMLITAKLGGLCCFLMICLSLIIFTNYYLGEMLRYPAQIFTFTPTFACNLCIKNFRKIQRSVVANCYFTG